MNGTCDPAPMYGEQKVHNLQSGGDWYMHSIFVYLTIGVNSYANRHQCKKL